jgi:hypothetical protein
VAIEMKIENKILAAMSEFPRIIFDLSNRLKKKSSYKT